MVRVCVDLFKAGVGNNLKKDGFRLHDMLKMQLDYYIQNITNDWDFTIIICGEGEVRVGKTIDSDTYIKVIDDGLIKKKKIGSFKDKEKIKTISWDFENNKEIISYSEVIKEKDVKEFYKVQLENGKEIICTMNHKLFVKRHGKIIESKLKYINEGDELVCQ